MRLLCINSGKLECSDGFPALGGILIEGQIYNCDGKIHDGRSDIGAKCYFIIELQQLKRCERFLVLTDENADSN